MSADHVIWHDLECGRYDADLPLWRELAASADGAVLDVGAGTGRVALDLAARGHEVVALDRDGALLAALRERAAARGLDVVTLAVDARDFDLGRAFALAIVPMQTIQLLGGAAGRAAFLGCARRHLRPGGRLAVALADALEGFDAEHSEPPPPDVLRHGGWVYASHPVAVREEPAAIAIERIREVVAPDGARSAAGDVIRLDRLDAPLLESEAAAAGFAPLPRTGVGATDEHVGSTVVVLGA